MIHQLELKTENLHRSFDHSYTPILTVNSGDTVQLTTPDIQWGYSKSKDEPKIQLDSREQEDVKGHPIIGPIEIKGAKPGMVLEVRTNNLMPGWYGTNWAGGTSAWQNEKLNLTNEEKIQLDWELDAKTMTGTTKVGNRELHVGLNPFMGLMGVAPAEPGLHTTPPPRRVGGNIDCKELSRGSSLFLPIEVDGGLFSIGDGHAAQGDGEVSGTAIEAPMDLVDITLTLHEDLTLNMPRAWTPAGWVTFGFDEDLNEATSTALDEMVQFIQWLYDVKKTEATALASTVVDLRVTQVVNGVKGAHAVLPHGAIR
ncbi:acetamidase/formamidase family protein [Aquisalibacillus elongatus]|uniref:Acetamidase/formamidase n=1 Tax=Aquisalibacillus elongatus TaxID=485577 RepID=A0A3N5AZX7_9BACI|nr:acetamidase/formamidase family protein [Aquisalibacillus elongatus]RPF50634.1 acetamidase/formamidase [Aquisalibacillus elongatus]